MTKVRNPSLSYQHEHLELSLKYKNLVKINMGRTIGVEAWNIRDMLAQRYDTSSHTSKEKIWTVSLVENT